ncbi:MAG: tryptophan synthase subunit alpha [Coriobacteriia bacterium]|nr:tryptophan synthase subunit alpha [Coriobacteriia bacterium]
MSDAPVYGERLGRAFAKGHPALVTYLMAGYPDHAGSLEAMRAVTRAGADLIEVGVPYSDQLADGPVIVDASARARQAAAGRYGLVESLALVKEFLADAGPGAPAIALMCYLNPIMQAGYARAATMIADAGVGGVIVPDLPPDMAGEWLEASRDRLDTVFLAAPTSTPERLKAVAAAASGFVYCVSTTGITGERAKLPVHLADTVARVKAHTTLPVAVGFGVSTSEQASAVAQVADGVVVGSALVRRQDDPVALEALARQMAEAVHSA